MPSRSTSPDPPLLPESADPSSIDSAPSPPKTHRKKPKDYYGERKRLDPEHICVGGIVWLPRRLPDEERLKCTVTGASLKDEGYNHPAVVIAIENEATSTDPSDPVVSIAAVRFRATCIRLVIIDLILVDIVSQHLSRRLPRRKAIKAKLFGIDSNSKPR
jgi:hypothetical protein